MNLVTVLNVIISKISRDEGKINYLLDSKVDEDYCTQGVPCDHLYKFYCGGSRTHLFSLKFSLRSSGLSSVLKSIF